MNLRQRVMVTLFIAIVALVGARNPHTVFACSCAEASEVEHYENADTVFSGVVKDISKDVANWSVDFEVDRFLKGGTGENITVTTGFGDGDCGFDFEVGEAYKVYAYGDDQLSTGICSGTMLLAEVDEPQEVPAVPSANGEIQDNDAIIRIVTTLLGVAMGSAATYLVLKRRTK